MPEASVLTGPYGVDGSFLALTECGAPRAQKNATQFVAGLVDMMLMGL